MPNPFDPLGLFDAAERDVRRIDSAFRSPAGIPAVEKADTPNAFDPLGIFDAVKRDVRRIDSAFRSPAGIPALEAHQERPAMLPRPKRPALALLPSPGVAVMPKLPPEARGDFLFFEDIRDQVRLGAKLTDEDVRRMWEARKKRPALVPAVIGPRERRQAPTELEYFADSAEQLLASTNPYRAQMDAAFREAIERVRG